MLTASLDCVRACACAYVYGCVCVCVCVCMCIDADMAPSIDSGAAAAGSIPEDASHPHGAGVIVSGPQQVCAFCCRFSQSAYRTVRQAWLLTDDCHTSQSNRSLVLNLFCPLWGLHTLPYQPSTLLDIQPPAPTGSATPNLTLAFGGSRIQLTAPAAAAATTPTASGGVSIPSAAAFWPVQPAPVAATELAVSEPLTLGM